MEYANSELAHIIDEYIHSERDRTILRLRFLDGTTYERIAEKVDMSPRQIQNIIYKHEKILFEYLRKKEQA